LNDPYQSPKTNPSRGHQRSEKKPVNDSIKKSKVIVFCFFSAIFYKVPYDTIPTFSELFVGFGAELPLISHLFISARNIFPFMMLISFVPLILLIVFIKKPHLSRLLYRLSLINFICSIILLPMTILALYLPIFYMGGKI